MYGFGSRIRGLPAKRPPDTIRLGQKYKYWAYRPLFNEYVASSLSDYSTPYICYLYSEDGDWTLADDAIEKPKQRYTNSWGGQYYYVSLEQAGYYPLTPQRAIWGFKDPVVVSAFRPWWHYCNNNYVLEYSNDRVNWYVAAKGYAQDVIALGTTPYLQGVKVEVW